MTHNKTLIGTITEKASASYRGLASDKIDFKDGKPGEGFKLWEAHWLAIAYEWRNELEMEGLKDTVASLDRTIAFVEKFRASN